MMMLQKVLFFVLTLAVADSRVSTRRLGSPHLVELKRKATTPKLSDKIKGKSLRQLGVKPETSIRQGQRRDEATLKFFSVYDEFGPSISTLGETAALNGYIFDFSKFGSGALTEDDVIGALRGSCSVVGGNDGEDHFCTYEILIKSDGAESFGVVIASGSLTYEVDDGGFLIVEALGEDFEEKDQGGILTLMYKATGNQNVIVGELQLS
eukprot:CAMPEP_0117003956 /NCGR_PEP_ID=MMETSP0472-20121206/5103_1 /TAXON_ID=693140 ORGANISM="Tiarina fusus, Strain LIS" /NCGR_SAMPLE_ID=MMETSP0472 /ASSEMBLY_ACC=CAM_ASM_000603 /LENGTH=208 /DNA_ID=CAMNT_0004704777 /DNA_START=100 /DNA_END=726 /DNA_ORIENTATION=+